MTDTKGLEAGSLFKLCMVGILTFTVVVSLLSFIAGLVFDGEWQGPQGYTSSSHSVEINNETVTESKHEEITTSSSVGGLFAYLAMSPFLSAIFAAIMWVYVIIGQFLYSLRKPIKLDISQNGIAFTSSFKLIYIGFFVCSLMWGILTTLASIADPEIGSWITFNGKEPGITGKLIMAVIFIPVVSAIAAAIMGLIIASGNYVFTKIKPISYIANDY